MMAKIKECWRDEDQLELSYIIEGSVKAHNNFFNACRFLIKLNINTL